MKPILGLKSIWLIFESICHNKMAGETLQLREWNTGPKIYLGNLGEKADKFKIAELFKVYGKLKNVIIAKRPIKWDLRSGGT